MKQYPDYSTSKQRGFTLVMAIFIVVILGLLGSYMVRLSSVQYTTTSYALQSARAYQTGRAGLSWATAMINNEAVAGQGCTPVNNKILTLPAMPGFTVTLTCQAKGYTEGGDTYYIYRITAHSEFADYNSVNYVSRELEKSVLTNQ
jgi:MSHA biogenesis protein MshP